MELMLVRHAVAEPQSPDKPDDRRALTPKGIARFRREVVGLERLNLRLNGVLHSPWLRAAETAELLTPVLDGDMQVEPLLADEPGEALIARLASLHESHRTALVGHQPWMADLLALLCFGSTRPAETIVFKKGGVAWLAGSPALGAMDLLALYPPRTLRRVGRPL